MTCTNSGSFNGEFNDEFNDISRSIVKQITCLHNGKAIPTIGFNYLNTVSPCVNSKQVCMFTYWKLLEQNSFGDDFKAVIFTNDTNVKSYDQLAKHMNLTTGIFNRDIEIITYITYAKRFDKNGKLIVKKKKKATKSKKLVEPIDINTAKPIILLLKYTEPNLMNKITTFSPDVVIVEEINRKKPAHIEFYGALKQLCSKTNESGSAVISFSRYLSTEDIVKKTGITDTIVSHRPKSSSDIISDNELYLKIVLMDSQTNMSNCKTRTIELMDRLDQNLQNSALKKVVVIFDDNADTDMKMYIKHYRENMYNYHNLMDVLPYDGTDQEQIDRFADLYTRTDSLRHLSKNSRTKLLESIVSSRADAGILFANLSTITSSKNTVALTNIDCVVNYSEQLKDDNINYRTVMMYLTTACTVDSQITLIEHSDTNVQKQLRRLHSMFYDQDKDRIENYVDFVKDIKSEKILIESESIKSQSELTKLEKQFNITKADKDYYNRFNVVYIVPLSTDKNDDLSTSEQYEIEKEYLQAKVSNDDLTDESELIKNTKSKIYSGPKWMGRDDRMEIPGNKVGLLNKTTKMIEICDIIDVHKFGRRLKRQEWREKGNKNKNILFLSPVRYRMKLAAFTNTVNKMKGKEIDPKKIKLMERFELGKLI